MNRLCRVVWASTILSTAALCYSQAQFTQACPNPNFPSPAQTVADGACPRVGTGGDEASQNAAKNNFCAPLGPQASPVLPVSFQTFMKLQAKVVQDGSINFGNPKKPVQDRRELGQMGEGRLVSLIGYVLIARQEGAESVNCGRNVPNAAARHDIHISLVAVRREQNECHSVVVEMSPHHRPAQWTAAIVERLAHANTPVRVTGQMFFDSSHLPCDENGGIGHNPKRFSLWEIHPIYKFEVCTANCNTPNRVWKDLTQLVNAEVLVVPDNKQNRPGHRTLAQKKASANTSLIISH